MASVAYGPEAIVIVLAAAGSHAIGYTFAVSAAIVALLTVLVLSYRQLIAAFPDGGGAYAVSKKYLGRHAPLVAAASLVLDYVLNVAVSVAAGTYTVWIALGVLLLITVVNLRGIVSSARLFIVPTVIFVVAIMSVIVVGLITGGHAQPAPASATGALTTVGVLLLLKAFANGCAALTGVEAIANATPQFRENRIRRAQRAEVALGVVLGVMMLGVSALVSHPAYRAARRRDSALADRRGGLRPWVPVLRRPDRHPGVAGAGRQHVVRRSAPTDEGGRCRRLPAPPVDQTFGHRRLP